MLAYLVELINMYTEISGFLCIFDNATLSAWAYI